MDGYHQEIKLIKKILNDNPKGMTVTDISRKIKINRNSVAKYLDIMRISGHVEMITFGPAKVFFPSRRVPISNMINYTSDYIIVFDKNLKITLVNDTFLEFIDNDRENIIGQSIPEILSKFCKDNLDLLNKINEALEGKRFNNELTFELQGENMYCNVKIIPTTFEDGRHGVTLIIKDKTDHIIVKNALKESNNNLQDLLKKISKK